MFLSFNILFARMDITKALWERKLYCLFFFYDFRATYSSLRMKYVLQISLYKSVQKGLRSGGGTADSGGRKNNGGKVSIFQLFPSNYITLYIKCTSMYSCSPDGVARDINHLNLICLWRIRHPWGGVKEVCGLFLSFIWCISKVDHREIIHRAPI